MKNFRPVSPHLSVYYPQNSSSFSILFRISGIILSLLILFTSFFSILFPFLLFSLIFINPIISILGFVILAFSIFHFIGTVHPNSYDF